MTKEEIFARLPKVKAEVDSHIRELLQLLRSANPLDFLAQFSLANLAKNSTPDKRQQADEARVEYLISLAMAQDYPADLASPTPPQIQRCFDLVRSIFENATFYHVFSKGLETQDEDPRIELSIQLQLNMLGVRGDAYYPHMRMRFEGVLGSLDQLLAEMFGFALSDLHDFLQRVEYEVNERLEVERLTKIRPLQEELAAMISPSRLKNGDMETLNEALEKLRVSQEAKFAELKSAFDSFGMAKLLEVRPQSDVEQRILDRFSCRFGENAAFLDQLPKFRGWPMNPSLFTSRPVLKTNDGYFLFHLQFFGRGVFALIRQLLEETNPEALKALLKARDDYTEVESLKLLSGALPGCQSYSNLGYDTLIDGKMRRTEVDGLIVYDDVLLIVEAKAHSLSAPGRRGAPSAIEDLKESIGFGFHQACRFRQVLEKEGQVECHDQNGRVVVVLERQMFQRIIPIVVTFDLFPVALGKLPLLKQLGILHGDGWPWAICLDDLRVATEILDRPSIFLHYITRRLRFNDFPKFEAQDELEYLMAYLENGLYLDHDSRFDTANTVSLVGYTDRLDDYYSRLTGYLNKGKKPRVKLSPRAKFFLDALESHQRRHFTSAALDFLDYDDREREKLLASWTERLQRLRQTGKAVLSSLSSDEDRSLLAVCFVTQLSSWLDVAVQRSRTVTMPSSGASRCTLIIVEPPLAAGKYEIRLLE